MKTIAAAGQTARETLQDGNKLKLGLFGHNCSSGLSMTKAPTGFEATWNHTLAICQRADRMGLEYLIPIARWRGLGGETNAFGTSFETMTWSAGIAALTQHSTVVSTLHLPLTHPVAAAKQCATLDHIAGGRYAFNAVMGWFGPDMAMFGGKMRDHEERYRYGTEWIQLVKRIWSEHDPFDFDGEFFQLKDVQSLPKPLQDPFPPILNAGGSPTGIDFAAREADINFAVVNDLDAGAKQVESAQKLAGERYGRDLTMMSNGFVVCRETEAEARVVVDQMVEMGDRVATQNFFREFGLGSESLTDEMRELIDRGIVGMGAPQFVGTPDQVAEGLLEMSKIGISGVIFGMLDYLEELPYFEAQVLPRLVDMGLRETFSG
jgi:FMNH2-dependent dimethyl sulfone monooxygenase